MEGLSLEEIKRKLIEDVCASCSGGDGADVSSNVGAEEGLGETPDKLVKTLNMIRKLRAKKQKVQ